MMFSLTRAAAQQIQRAAADGDAQDLVLRVAARREPDGRIDYGMGFDDAAEADTRLQIADVRVVIAPQHVDLLQDTVLDFVALAPGQHHFVFIPQPSAAEAGSGCASASAGCGSCGSGSSCGSRGGRP